MAAQLPTQLRGTDLGRFALRGAQVEKAKPAIAYWCNYYIINQIMSRDLHTTDPECYQYITVLLEKLEKAFEIKAENADNDAFIDDAAAQAYVEQFALEILERANRAVEVDKVTGQTKDAFLAAATFLELVNIWGPPTPETVSKIKYAKWNAVRIAQAIKEGKDPNESNPKPDVEADEELPPLDPNDPEVQALSDDPSKSRQPSVVEVTDEQDQVDRRLAAQSNLDRSLHPSAQPSARASPKQAPFDPFPRSGFPYNITKDNEVSPIEPVPSERDGSVGGGYFPEVHTHASESGSSTLPTVPPDDYVSPPELPDTSQLSAPGTKASDDITSFPPPRGFEQPPPPAPQDFYRSPPLNQVQPSHSRLVPAAASVIPQASASQQYNTDDESQALAQKHARWAISALNFEDSKTAVKELEAALRALGAR